MRARGFLIVALAALGVGMLVFIAGTRITEGILVRSNAALLTETARTAASFLDRYRVESLPARERYARFCGEIARDSRFRVTLIDAAGDVLADSSFDVSRMQNHADRPEVRAALGGTSGWARRRSSTADEWMLYAAIPLAPGLPEAGQDEARVLRLALELPSLLDQAKNSRWTFAALSAAAILASLAASALLAHVLSSPVRHLAERARGYATRGYPARAALPVPDRNMLPPEFRVLGDALDSLAADLTRKADEAERMGSRYAGILDSAAEGIIAVDEKLSIIEANPAAHRLLGASPDSLRGADLSTAGASEAIIALVRESIRNRAPRDAEVQFYSSGERILQVKTSSFGSGAAAGAVIVLADITVLKRLERMRTDFVANVSHELRTPIHLIQGFSETLAADLADASASTTSARESRLHYVEIIRKNAIRMERIVSDLLMLARLERDPSGWLTVENCHADRLIGELVSTARHLATPKSVRIETTTAGERSFRANPGLIEQALFNLVENAIRYSPEGGMVTIEVYGDTETIEFKVRDRGSGIPAPDLPRIFERFYRADKSRDRKSGGTGLGLAIVRHIALAHGGSVNAESWAGEGSVFSIRIPRIPRQAENRQQA